VLGELISAREHYESGVALYNPLQHRALAFLYGQDPKVSSLSPMAWALWELGYPDQALKSIHEALTVAQDLSHPYSLTFALGFAAWIHQYRREEHLAQRQAEAAITLSVEQGIPLWLAWGTITRGWALAEQGRGVEGVKQIRQGWAALQAMGAELQGSYFLALLAEVYGKVGKVEEGLNALAEALAFVDKTGEHYYEAELYRIKGELSLAQSKTSPRQVQDKSQTGQEKSEDPNPQHPTPSTQTEAEACFLKAIEIAQKQQAKSLELRATMSLARQWQQQGKTAEARQMLAEIYNWFTEGFDTKDLQEAKALLEELSQIGADS
jgi:predicted ATPase